jgi:lauroyl/myristoyl acyltransferase
VTRPVGSRLPLAQGWDALWRARPPHLGLPTWLLLLALDPLPWPWGEAVLAKVFVAKAFLQPRLLLRAIGWAGAQPNGSPRRWRLALALFAHRGRAVGRLTLLGLRRPDTLRARVAIQGEEHLHGAPGGVILLGFHLGLPGSDVALRLLGHPVGWLGGWRSSPGWSREGWRAFREAGLTLSLSEGKDGHGAVLHRARRVLLEGGCLYMLGDGSQGREVFQVPLPGRPMVLRAGWFTLRRLSNATVLPVLGHREKRTHVVTIHPPLPPPAPDAASDAAACREALRPLLEDYVTSFPEQCYSLVFRPTAADMPRPQSAPSAR